MPMLSLKTTQFFKTRPQQELEGEMHFEWEWVKMMLLDWISDKGGGRIWITLAATFAANAIIIKEGGSSNTDYGRNRSFPASEILFHNSFFSSLFLYFSFFTWKNQFLFANFFFIFVSCFFPLFLQLSFFNSLSLTLFLQLSFFNSLSLTLFP